MTINVRRSGADPIASRSSVFRSLKPIAYKAESGFSYVYFSTPHGFKTGDSVTVQNLDSRFNGTWSIIVNDIYTISWDNDFSTTNATGSTTLTLRRTVTRRKRENNVAFIETSVAHQFVASDSVEVGNVAVNFIVSNQPIKAINSSTIFSYDNVGNNTADASNPTGWIDTSADAYAEIVRRYTDVTSVSMSGNRGTVNFNSTSPIFVAGQVLSVSVPSQPWLSVGALGLFTITSVGSSSVTVNTTIPQLNLSSSTNASVFGWTKANKVSVWIGTESSGYWSDVYPDIPVAVSTSGISGSGGIGTSFSLANPFIFDLSEYRAPTSYSFQWQKSSSTASNATWSNVGSASSSLSSYVVTSDDVGFYFRLAVTASNLRGSSVPYYTDPSVQVPPATPTINSFEIRNIKQREVDAAWTSVNQAKYTLKVFLGTNTGATPVYNPGEQTSTTQGPITITNLLPDTQYTATLQIRNSLGTLSGTSSVTFTTKTDDATLTSVTVNSITKTSATVNWVATNQKSYRVRVYPGTNTSGTPLPHPGYVNDTSTRSVGVTGLSPDTTYTAQVSVWNVTDPVGIDPVILTAQFTTDTNNPSITSVTISDITATSATVTWTAVNQNEYRVRAYKNSNTSLDPAFNTNRQPSTSKRTQSITGLEPETSYGVTVEIWNDNTPTIESDSYPIQSFTTTPLTPSVDTLVVNNIKQTQADVRWTSTNQKSYRVRIYNGSGTSGTVAYTSGTQDSTLATNIVTADTLVADGTYTAQVSVWAAAAGGGTPDIKTYQFTTATNDPIINSFFVNNIQITQADVNWTSTRQSEYRVRVYLGTNTGATPTYNSLRVPSTVTDRVTATGLSPGTLYTAVLEIWNSIAETTSSSTTFTTTSNNPVINSFSIGSVGRTSFTANWTSTRQADYRVRVLRGTTNVFSTGQTPGANVRSVSVTGLTANTLYTVELTLWSSTSQNVTQSLSQRTNT